MTDIEKAKQSLAGHTIALCKGGDIVTSDKRGIAPMLGFIAKNQKSIRGNAEFSRACRSREAERNLAKKAAIRVYRIFLIFTAPHKRSEYEYAVFPRKFFSSGSTVKRAGYTPESTPEKVSDLFLPRFTFTRILELPHVFTYSFTSDKLRVFFSIPLFFLFCIAFIRFEKKW